MGVGIKAAGAHSVAAYSIAIGTVRSLRLGALQHATLSAGVCVGFGVTLGCISWYTMLLALLRRFHEGTMLRHAGVLVKSIAVVLMSAGSWTLLGEVAAYMSGTDPSIKDVISQLTTNDAVQPE